MTDDIKKQTKLAEEYLGFFLGKEEYCIKVVHVKEILAKIETTWVPKTPDYIRGVINLRGAIHPVIDLRRKFEMEYKEDTNETCIVVVEVKYHGEDLSVGIIIDKVSEVVVLKEEYFRDAPKLNTEIDEDFITGMAIVDGKMKIILDIQHIVDTIEI